jgi:enterochelin esterase family protein
VFDPASRLDYKFVVDGSIWISDPRNPDACAGGYGSNSELRMPKFRYPVETAECQGKACGVQVDTSIQSSFMGQPRRFVVLLPPNYKATTQAYPCIYIHDGQDFLHYGQAQHILANLMADQSMQEAIAVFVYPVERDAEYSGKLQDAFTNFMVAELVPWVDSNFCTLTKAEHRLVMGISNGGNISLWQAATHPEVFGNVAAQSSNVEENILKAFKKKKLLPLRIYTDIGLYDLSVLKPKVAALHEVLTKKGYDYKHVVLPDGHSWCNWRSHLKDIFMYFFPKK